MRQVPYWRPTDIRRHRKEFRCNGDVEPGNLCTPVLHNSLPKTIPTVLRFSSVLRNKINWVCLSLLVTWSLYATDPFCQGMMSFVRVCVCVSSPLTACHWPTARLSDYPVLSLLPCSCKAPGKRICVTSLQPIRQDTTMHLTASCWLTTEHTCAM
jgi:hypothetical protein